MKAEALEEEKARRPETKAEARRGEIMMEMEMVEWKKTLLHKFVVRISDFAKVEFLRLRTETGGGTLGQDSFEVHDSLSIFTLYSNQPDKLLQRLEFLEISAQKKQSVSAIDASCPCAPPANMQHPRTTT